MMDDPNRTSPPGPPGIALEECDERELLEGDRACEDSADETFLDRFPRVSSGGRPVEGPERGDGRGSGRSPRK